MLALFRNLKKIGTHDGTIFWINLDPCGLICGLLTYFFLGYAMYATTLFVIDPWLGVGSFLGLLNTVAFNALCVLASYAHFKAMVTDPGAVPRSALPLTSEKVTKTLSDGATESVDGTTAAAASGDIETGTAGIDASPTPAPVPARSIARRKEIHTCKKCRVFKPPRAHHCSQCRRCVTKMDHHCPWVNNCVGIGNQKLFLLFLLYTCLSCIYSLALISLRYTECYYHPTRCVSSTRASSGASSAGGHICVLFLVIEALLFGMFTCCMLGEQYESIDTSETTVERIIRLKYSGSKGEEPRAPATQPIITDGDRVNEFVEIFGTPYDSSASCFTWRAISTYFIPEPVQYCSGELRDRIYGYTTQKSQAALDKLGQIRAQCRRTAEVSCPPCDSCSSRGVPLPMHVASGTGSGGASSASPDRATVAAGDVEEGIRADGAEEVLEDAPLLLQGGTAGVLGTGAMEAGLEQRVVKTKKIS